MEESIPVPQYLEATYWWAYARPWAVRLFDRQSAVNGILLGNYNRLRDEALAEFDAKTAAGRTLQVGCCYGNLSPYLAARLAKGGGTLDIIDVLKVQLDNLPRKVPPSVGMSLMDAAALTIPDAQYDTVLIFLLLHEQPQAYRERTLQEAFRVLKPGGKLIIVDYGAPAWWHPARVTTLPLYRRLKPYAVEVWDRGLPAVIPEQMSGHQWRTTTYFGGLFQKFVTTK